MIQRIAALVVIVAIVLGGGYYAYGQLFPKPVETKAGPTYATEPVTRGDISVSVEATGPLNPAEGGALFLPWRDPSSSNVQYTFDHYMVKEGDTVKAGQVVAVLQAPSLSQTIEQDQQQLDDARKQLASLLGIPVDQVDFADVSQGIVIRAPIAGRVSGLSLKEGDTLEDGQNVAQIVNDGEFVIRAALLAGEVASVKVGDTAFLRFSAYDGFVKAQVTDVKRNLVPVQSSKLTDCSGIGEGGGDEYTYVAWVTIRGENPGLIVPGMKAQVAIAPKGTNPDTTALNWARYCQTVEGYGQQQTIVSPAKGTVTQVFVDDLATVEAGDPIVAMAGSDVRDELNQLKEKIFEAQQKLAQDQALAGQLEIRAPTDGVVVNLQPMNPGQPVQPGQWFGQVFNPAHMMMWVQVSDVDVVKVRQGAKVTITTDALPGEKFEGTVQQVSMAGKDQNGVTQFQVTIDVAGGPNLRPGMQANAHIDAGSAKDTLLVPIEAVFEDRGQPAVEVLNKDGTTKTVPIKVGLMNDRYVQVLEGLKEGDLVITGSTADLLPSQHINGQGGLLPGNGGNGGSGGNGGNGGGSGGSSGGDSGGSGGSTEPASPGGK